MGLLLHMAQRFYCLNVCTLFRSDYSEPVSIDLNSHIMIIDTLSIMDGFG